MLISEKFAHTPIEKCVNEAYLTAKTAGGPAEFQLTRKDAKASQREIPWHLSPSEPKPIYYGALVREWRSWIRFGAVGVMP